MTYLEYLVVILYTLSIVMLFIYSLVQLNLLCNYILSKKLKISRKIIDLNTLKDGFPIVTIQLPVYNELYVMERLLMNIGGINYPKDRLEIQVLDDSTDESFDLAKVYIKELKKQGFDIHHLHRTDRRGFKAGALKEGLKTAKGEYIAIFDADFLPQKDWLLQTLPYFSDERIGLIQTKWGHLNKDYSTLTKVQSFALDAHFTLEQVGRNSQGHFINFNGTAGIWRKECILDAGNWEGDTLTEDLDLSYRAQLKNWKFIYLEHVETPAELPIAISAAKSQQFRWNKGGAENFRKMLMRIIKSKNISLKTKIHGIFHLLNSTMFLNVLIVAVLSVPMLYIKHQYTFIQGYFIALSFFLITTIIYFMCYWYMYKTVHGSGFKKFVSYIGMFFTFFSIAMGFSVHNTLAVLEGHIGRKSDFIRTPKFNLSSSNKNWKENKYITNKISVSTILEGLLMLYFSFGMYSSFIVKEHGVDLGLFPFHLMLFLGFGYVFVQSLTNSA